MLCGRTFNISEPFEAGPFIPGPFEAGPFIPGPFEAGPFIPGPFEAGPFEDGRFVGVHCKKRFAIFPSPAGMSPINLSLDGNYLIIPAQGEFSQ
jgi:hypothetical protein